MKTYTMIWLSALLFTAAATYNLGPLAGIVVFGFHIMVHTLHRIEVKINRLLDLAGVTVTEAELRE